MEGKVFRSVEKLTGGERRDGTINLIHWTIRFKGKEFTWRRTDTLTSGTYEYDPKKNEVVLKEARIKAEYDAKTGVLTWSNRKYVEANEGK